MHAAITSASLAWLSHERHVLSVLVILDRHGPTARTKPRERQAKRFHEPAAAARPVRTCNLEVNGSGRAIATSGTCWLAAEAAAGMCVIQYSRANKASRSSVLSPWRNRGPRGRAQDRAKMRRRSSNFPHRPSSLNIPRIPGFRGGVSCGAGLGTEAGGPPARVQVLSVMDAQRPPSAPSKGSDRSSPAQSQ
ncbi:hypothetical protein GGTG_04077 [Gaeumannomyces tritici R3-111a-1]|uniref:Uncharacterized protein n=1 Tax=Gaeumannomyces tritici (strain R3-111a-1) TaxID=644352 RepID=J3NS30_GAET3|nr:hypothetical protein GGTG_04077 [Gaeumannomyces tritici R3-111a-1]EJT78986.1 hypothetical protein GGTG_04077 [Gaeumannomyces tritici R3-111a-1]